MFITPSLGGGGLERAAVNFANMAGDNVKIFMLTISDEKPFYSINNNVEVFNCYDGNTKFMLFNFIQKMIWLRKVLIEINPEVICCFGERYNPYFILASLRLSKRIVVLNRASPLSYINGYKKILGKVTYNLADQVIFQTEIARNIVREAYELRRTYVLGNPVNVSYSKQSREKIILNVGSFNGSKNQKTLIEVFNRLVKRGVKNWQLHFIGSGVNLQRCKKLTADLGLAPFVMFHGQVKNVETILASSEVFAFVSESEGFPNALAEALAFGCASIAFDCIAGPADLIEDGVNGFLIPMNEIDLYEERLFTLLGDEKKRKEFSGKAKEFMQRFDASSISKEFYNIVLK